MTGKNFAVWSMQRTGGTTFTSLLSAMHPRETVHEPFNGRRSRSEFAEDVALIKQGRMGKRFPSYNLKHCFEYRDDGFNHSLFALLKSCGYFLILLERKNHLERIESLALAQLTGAYGVASSKELYPRIVSSEVTLREIDINMMIRHLRRSLTRESKVRSMVSSAGFPIIYYEDFFRGPSEDVEGRLMALRAQMCQAGCSMEVTEQYLEIRDHYVEERHQRSHLIAEFVPNIEEFRVAVREVLEGV